MNGVDDVVVFEMVLAMFSVLLLLLFSWLEDEEEDDAFEGKSAGGMIRSSLVCLSLSPSLDLLFPSPSLPSGLRSTLFSLSHFLNFDTGE